jgi:hypothetical protein
MLVYEYQIIRISIMSYTVDVLNTRAQTDNAILIAVPNELTQMSRIGFRCACGTEDAKGFRSLLTSGLMCTQCTRLNSIEKRRITNIERYGVPSNVSFSRG